MSTTKKSPIPISNKTMSYLFGEVYANLSNQKITLKEAEAALRTLTGLQRVHLRKIRDRDAVGIEKDEAQEGFLVKSGFVFWPLTGDYIKKLGPEDNYWLRLFLNEQDQPTASLTREKKELGNWSLSDLEADLAEVVAKAEALAVDKGSKYLNSDT